MGISESLSLPRLLSLLDHHLPQSPVDARLVAPPRSLEPRQHVGVQPQRHRPLHRLVHAGPLLLPVPRTPSPPPTSFNFCHFSGCPSSFPKSFALFYFSPFLRT